MRAWTGRSGRAGPAPVSCARCPLPAPGPDEVLVRTLSRRASAAAPSGSCSRPRAAGPVRGDARPVPGRRVPGAGEVRLPQRRRRRAGPGAPCRPHGVLPVPAPDALRRAGRRGHRRARRTCRPAGRCSPAPSRPRSTRCGTRAPLLGDRIAVLGAGMVGCCVARLLAGMPGVQVDAGRRRRVAGRRSPPRSASAFAPPDDAPGERDLVVHTSATAAGLRRALELLRTEGTVVELSWYGDAEVPLALGGAFHSRRLTIRASQVGTVSPARRPARHADRLALALELLHDPAFDALLTGDSALRRAARGDGPARLRHAAGLCHTVRYDEETERVQRDRPRPHDDRPQLPRRGVRTRTAAARRDLRRRRDLPPGRAGRRQHRRRHRAGHDAAARRAAAT